MHPLTAAINKLCERPRPPLARLTELIDRYAAEHAPGWKKVGGSSVHVNADGTIDKGCPGLKGEAVADLIDEEDESRERRAHRQQVAAAKGLTGHDVTASAAKRLETQGGLAAHRDVQHFAQMYEVPPEHVLSMLDEAWKLKQNEVRDREQIRALARQRTGLDAGSLARAENNHFDYSSFKGFDDAAHEMALSWPEILGDPNDWNANPAEKLWELIREGKQTAPSKWSPEVIESAAQMVASYGGGSREPAYAGVSDDYDPENDRFARRFAEAVERYTKSADEAASETHANPSDAQRERGNYRKGKFTVHGLTIAIETPKGTVRSGKSREGSEWSVTMPAHYGYIQRTEGRDGDHVDVFIGPQPESEIVYAIDQNTLTGRFDEHKVMIGFTTQEAAVAAYRASRSDDADRRIRDVTPMTTGQFKAWLAAGDMTQPIAGQVSKYSRLTEIFDREFYARLGSVERYAPKKKPAAGQKSMAWNEDEHPRNEAGEFAKTEEGAAPKADEPETPFTLKQESASGRKKFTVENAIPAEQGTLFVGTKDLPGQASLFSGADVQAARSKASPPAELPESAKRAGIKSLRDAHKKGIGEFVHTVDATARDILKPLEHYDSTESLSRLVAEKAVAGAVASGNSNEGWASAARHLEALSRHSDQAHRRGFLELAVKAIRQHISRPAKAIVDAFDREFYRLSGLKERYAWKEADHPRDNDGKFAGDGNAARRMPADPGHSHIPDPSPLSHQSKAFRNAPDWKPARAAASKKFTPHFKNSGLTKRKADQYQRAIINLMNNMTATALTRLTDNAERFVLYENLQELNTECRKRAPGSDKASGFWQPLAGHRGEIHVDGGKESGEQIATSCESVYAHEVGHAIDGGLSADPGWIRAWQAEIELEGDPLTHYARVRPSEGFAEFSRMIHMDPEKAQTKFPLCWKFWREKGLV